jgi:hypothetical protein
MSAPTTLADLTAAETVFLNAMQRLGFGRFEYLRVRLGQLVLEPWPAAVQDIKFAAGAHGAKPANVEQTLRPQVAEFFGKVRAIPDGEIRALVIRHGVPFSMELELTGTAQLAAEGCRG